MLVVHLLRIGNGKPRRGRSEVRAIEATDDRPSLVVTSTTAGPRQRLMPARHRHRCGTLVDYSILSGNCCH